MLSQFPFKNSMCCSSVRLYWNICVKVEMCFPSLALKLPPFRVNSTWLPNPNHDCSLSQAHPHVDLSWSSVQAKREAEKKKSRSVAVVSPRLTCILQICLTPGVQCTERIMKRSASRAPLRPIRDESCWSVRADRNAPRPIRGVFQTRVHTWGTWLGYTFHVSKTGEDKHCCCVKCSVDAAPNRHS